MPGNPLKQALSHGVAFTVLYNEGVAEKGDDMRKGKCRRCAQVVTVRKGNIAREHRYPAWVSPSRKTCSGSGLRVRELLAK